ncbi:NAD-dependent deacylase [bacterium]|nr:MAG: NAD-dependent deacylase [bacterium]
MVDQIVEIPGDVAQQLKVAESVAVMTGAGVSAESGIPTFRGDGGLWKNHRPEQLATPQAFQKDPDLVWEWYHWRRGLIRESSPNAAHHSIVQVERNSNQFTLITQNVDGLHLTAGSQAVLEIHGNIHRARCSSCANRVPLSTETGVLTCEQCGALMRPDVVWFGENLDQSVLEASHRATSTADFFLVAGTSSVVQPAASLAYAAKERGAYVLEVNLDPTPLTGTADVTILGKAGAVLSALVDETWG